jgi:hypothetical protein
MKAEIIKLNEEKLQMINTFKTQQAEIDIRKEQLSKLLAKYRKLENNHKNILAEYRISKEKVDELEEQYKIQQEMSRQKEHMSDGSTYGDVDDEIQKKNKILKPNVNRPMPQSNKSALTHMTTTKPTNLNTITNNSTITSTPTIPNTPTSSDMDDLIKIHTLNKSEPVVKKPIKRLTINPLQSRYVQSQTVDKINENTDSDDGSEQQNETPEIMTAPFAKIEESKDDAQDNQSDGEVTYEEQDNDQTKDQVKDPSKNDNKKPSVKTDLGYASKLSDIY